MSAYLADLATVLACAGQLVLNFSPALAVCAVVGVALKSVSPGCRRGSERTTFVSNSGYHTTAAQLRASAHYPFEDLERMLEQTYSPSTEYRAELERGIHDIADWISYQPQRVGGPLYPRVTKLRTALRDRCDRVTRELGEASWEQIIEGRLNGDDNLTRAEQLAIWGKPL